MVWSAEAAPAATSPQTRMTGAELRGRTGKFRPITSQHGSTASSCVMKPFLKTGQPQTGKSMSVWLFVVDLKPRSPILCTSPRVSMSSGDIPAPEEHKRIHLPTSEGRRLIRPYVHQDLINPAPVKRHLGFCAIWFWKEKSF